MERNVQFKLKQTNIFFEVFTSIHFLKLLKANELQSIITTRFEFKRFIEEKLLLLSFQIIKIVINDCYFTVFPNVFPIVQNSYCFSTLPFCHYMNRYEKQVCPFFSNTTSCECPIKVGSYEANEVDIEMPKPSLMTRLLARVSLFTFHKEKY